MRTNSGADFFAAQLAGTPGAAANYIALSTSATAPAAADTTLGGELVASGGGLVRSTTTYAHTTGTSTYTLMHTYTANATDGASNTINKIGVFTASSGGTLVFETAVPNPPTLVPGDSIAITESVSF